MATWDILSAVIYGVGGLVGGGGIRHLHLAGSGTHLVESGMDGRSP